MQHNTHGSINIPCDITKKILLKENDIILNQSYKEWYYIQIQNTLHRNILFCEEFYRGLLLNDIVHINGNFNTLTYHVDCYRKLKRESEEQALFIMSFRF